MGIYYIRINHVGIMFLDSLLTASKFWWLEPRALNPKPVSMFESAFVWGAGGRQAMRGADKMKPYQNQGLGKQQIPNPKARAPYL